jgi:hypothetical protein
VRTLLAQTMQERRDQSDTLRLGESLDASARLGFPSGSRLGERSYSRPAIEPPRGSRRGSCSLRCLFDVDRGDAEAGTRGAI